MESQQLCNKSDLSEFDENHNRYIGWENNLQQIPELKILFTEGVFKNISKRITELLKGVHPEGNPIVVSNRVIGHMISSIYHNDRIICN